GRADGVENRPRIGRPRRERSDLRDHRRDRDGAPARTRRRGLRALRLGLSQFPRTKGFRGRPRRVVRRGRGRRRREEMTGASVAFDPDLDARFMALALALGRRGLGNTWPNPAVGAVIVRNEPHGPVVVGRGWTQPGGRPHAEVEALGRAGAAARGATIYTTLEPCSHFGQTPPCADAIIVAGIARVVSALDDPNPEIAGEGYRRLRAQGITVVTGVGAEEARRAHAGHVRRMREG